MTRHDARLAVLSAALLLGATQIAAVSGAARDTQKLELVMTAKPNIAFSPARVAAVAELKGDALPDQMANLHCPLVEWDWGDGTRSEAETDCAPYEEGKSELKRRFSAQHTFSFPGTFRVQIRLKRNNRVVMSDTVNVQVRPGARDFGY